MAVFAFQQGLRTQSRTKYWSKLKQQRQRCPNIKAQSLKTTGSYIFCDADHKQFHFTLPHPQFAMHGFFHKCPYLQAQINLTLMLDE